MLLNMDNTAAKRGREAADTDASSPPAEPVRTKSNGGRGTAAAAAAANRAGIGIIVNDADASGAFTVATVTPLHPHVIMCRDKHVNVYWNAGARVLPRRKSWIAG